MDIWVLAALGSLASSVAWALLQTRKAKRAAQVAADARAEAERVIKDTTEDKDRERFRLQNEARTHLAGIDEQLASERAAIRGEAKRIEAHYEREYGKALTALAPLKRYQGIADAEAEAKRVLAEALKLAQRLREQSEAHAEQAKLQAGTTAREAALKLRALRDESDTILSKATDEARRLVDEAHARAEAIAGSAYVALREKDSLDQAVKAIRNVIDGYGDRYVVPTRSVLDGLAADYGHVEAGEELKKARDHSARMAEQGHAAECDYAEPRRRDSAVRFVVDAFNGRVDAILSRTRQDNLGTMEQEIRDAFALVNLNGEAFRNARIRPAYLDSRLAELKWAVATQELRLRDREEQRRLQEQIRDEERAQREIDRALKEAEKEESALKKALEMARAEVAAASQEQQGALELRIAELNERLAQTEEKNQRALSMAQQTRAGNVYIISNVGSFGENVVKIGMTRRMDPLDRVRELSDASVPFLFDVHAMIKTDDAPALEKELHERYDELRLNRVNYRKEFFRIPVRQLRDFVAEKGLVASFTLTAEAREYRESLALSKMSPADAAKFRNAVALPETVEGEG